MMPLPAKIEKKRIDQLLVEKKMAASREKSRSLILSGSVYVDSRRVDKPGTMIAEDARIDIKGNDIAFVSRGGLKLEHAVKQLGLTVSNKNCLDVGASTGGFTDCLLQFGAGHVYAVDVGYGQLAWKLRNDPRVTVIERTNIRYLSAEALPVPVDLAVIDVSFISLKIVVPAVLKFMKPSSRMLALIKPQFEVGKGKVGKGGIVRDTTQHEEVIRELVAFFSKNGLVCGAVIPSPIVGSKGNREFMIDIGVS
ncbi:MAG: TlyA family RNA methyltransferase [Desulfobacterales bacterium]